MLSARSYPFLITANSIGSFLGLAQNSKLRAITSLYSDDPADGAPFGTGDLPSFKGGVLDKKADAIYGDIDMIGTRRNLVEVYANSSTSKAWSYRFDHLPEYLSVQQGVGHGAEGMSPVICLPHLYLMSGMRSQSETHGAIIGCGVRF